jgi:hypothetical protein
MEAGQEKCARQGLPSQASVGLGRPQGGATDLSLEVGDVEARPGDRSAKGLSIPPF